MIELVIHFKETGHFYIFASVSALCIVWAYLSRKSRPWQIWPFVTVNLILSAAWGMLYRFNHDDVAFLHFAWLISKGFVPFVDFWEHHSPLLPVLMAPLLKTAPHSPVIFDAARVFSGLVFAVNAMLGWRIAQQVWGKKARLSVYLLFASSAVIMGQYLILRPDIFMIFFMLSGISLSFDVLRKGPGLCLLCGIAFGIAITFIPKQYFLVLLPVVAIILGDQGKALKLIAYCLGFCVGLAPLVWYLASTGVAGDYIAWVIGFNSRVMKIYVNFPAVYLAGGIWGAVVLFRRYRTSKEAGFALFLCALVLSTASSFTRTSTVDPLLYYHGLWYLLCAIAVCGAGLHEATPGARDRIRYALIAGLVFGVLTATNLSAVWEHRAGDYGKDREEAALLMRYTAGGSCLVLLPVHPVFAADATRLYSNWQFYFAGKYAQVRQDVSSDWFARKIIDQKPAVIMAESGKKDFILELYQNKIITAGEYKDLMSFIKEYYRKRKLGRHLYYIRADVLIKS